jgi:Ca-activated chloride channel homolog
VIRTKRPLWQNPLFQRPLIVLCFCLIAAALFGIFGFGRPNIAVAIALDLSGSTYQPQAFNAPGTIMQQEVAAVKAYLEVNSKLPNPNTIQVFGIGGGKAPALTSNRISPIFARSESA